MYNYVCISLENVTDGAGPSTAYTIRLTLWVGHLGLDKCPDVPGHRAVRGSTNVHLYSKKKRW